MISGFVISLSAEGQTRSSLAFNRAVRLLPTFWVCLAITVVALAAGGVILPGRQVLANVPIIAKWLGQNYVDDVYWSLAVELVFYGVVCTLLGPNFRERLGWFAMTWTGLCLACALFPNRLLHAAQARYGAFFAVGMFAFLGRRRLAVAAALVGGLAAWQMATTRLGRDTSPALEGAVAATIGLLFPLIAHFEVPSWLRRPAYVAGAASYPLYLIHNRFGLALGLSLAGTVIVVLGVSVVLGVAEVPIRCSIRALPRSIRRDPVVDSV
jgi:peptidoglycan/LPS O-acetylase OafA/YrhL